MTMDCFKCKTKMDYVDGINTDYFKLNLYKCKKCGAKADVFFHPLTESIRKVLWEES